MVFFLFCSFLTFGVGFNYNFLLAGKGKDMGLGSFLP